MKQSEFEQFKNVVKLGLDLNPGETIPVQSVSPFKRFLQFINIRAEIIVGYIIGFATAMIIAFIW